MLSFYVDATKFIKSDQFSLGDNKCGTFLLAFLDHFDHFFLDLVFDLVDTNAGILR